MQTNRFKQQSMKISILGTGLMGKRISLLFADGGYQVVIWNHVMRDRVLQDLKRESKLWKLDFEHIMKRLSLTENLAELAESAIVIESVIEDFGVKANLLKRVSSLLSPNVMIVSNTSSLSIVALAKFVSHPERFHGLHFFNPPQQIKFAEISRGHATTDASLSCTIKVLEELSISYVVLSDLPGSVVNNLLFSLINSAIMLAETSGLEAKVIDNAMKLGAKHPMGPLKLADFIGLDTSLNILKNLYQRTGEEKFKPSKLLVQLVQEQRLGRKAGNGFYQYR